MPDVRVCVPELPSRGWTLFSAQAINDAGVIVGTGARSGFASIRAFRLDRQPAEVADASISTLLTVSPNPLREQSMVSWTQSEPGLVDLRLFDTSGRLVATRTLWRNAGPTTAPLRDLANGLPNGAYWIEVDSETFSGSRRVTVVR